MVCRAGALPASGGAEFIMEKIIYIQSHNEPSVKETPINIKTVGNISFSEKLSNFLVKVAKIVAVLGILFLFISFTPSVWYTITTSGQSERVSGLLAETVESAKNPSFPTKREYQPKFNSTYPVQNKIKIPSIGLDGEVQEATYENYEAALKQGVWRVPDFGTPFGRERPTIFAAHRFGYLVWSSLFRRKNSFYNLPKLKEGDIVEIYWKQRKYVYEIYKSQEGEKITDYSADLILYTCENLNSSIRIFKYARLLEI